MRSEELIYANVDGRAVGRLNAFRERSTRTSDVIDGLLYRTFSLGDGEEATVFLPGGMAHGEVWFPQALHLRSLCRAIVFSLPESKDMDQLADGIAQMIRQMGVKRAVLVGYSMGGLVAQVMARRHGDLVVGMGLISTGAPAKDLPASIVAKWVDRRKLAFRTSLMNFNNGARMSMAENAFQANCPEGMEQQLDFWRAFIEDTYCNHMYKKQFAHLNYVAVPELYKRQDFAPEDLKDWKGQVLIMDSDNDPVYVQEEREALRRLYPEAKTVVMGSEGQFSMLIHEEMVSEELEKLFLRCCPPQIQA